MEPHELPPAGYGVNEVERILNIPKRTGYRLLKLGKLKSFMSLDNALKVHPWT